MERLSSCYFCGVAVDAPLGEYPVVPRELDPTAEATVTLCPTCRRKLGTVVERVVEATEADAATVDDAEIPDDGPTADEAASGPDEPANGVGDEATAEPADETAAVGESGTEAEANEEPAGGTPADGVRTDEAPADDAKPDEGTLDGTQADATPEDETQADGEPAGEAPAAPGGTQADEPLADVTVSVTEYNRVIRLLQNREFPVDRAEFAAIASEAYDVPESDVEAILEAAVRRGLLEREGDLLVRPGE